MNKKTAEEIIQKTREVYDRIAEPFSQKRSYLPQDLRDLAQSIQPGDKLLDLGCGNGRFCELCENAEYTGVDTSPALVEIAGRKYPDKFFRQIDFSKLPFAENSFDKVFSLAVIHHLPSGEFRQEFLSEAFRVLKPGGKLILTSWYMLHNRKHLAKLTSFALAKIAGKNKLDIGDMLVPFSTSQGELLAERYYHAFSLHGLASLVRKTGFNIESAGLVPRNREKNIHIIAVKPD